MFGVEVKSTPGLSRAKELPFTVCVSSSLLSWMVIALAAVESAEDDTLLSLVWVQPTLEQLVTVTNVVDAGVVEKGWELAVGETL